MFLLRWLINVLRELYGCYNPENILNVNTLNTQSVTFCPVWPKLCRNSYLLQWGEKPTAAHLFPFSSSYDQKMCLILSSSRFMHLFMFLFV